MLLHIVKGPKFPSHLRTVQGVIYNTKQTACKAMRLLEYDSPLENTLSEAGTSLDYSFPVIVAFSVTLWNKFQDNMTTMSNNTSVQALDRAMRN